MKQQPARPVVDEPPRDHVRTTVVASDFDPAVLQKFRAFPGRKLLPNQALRKIRGSSDTYNRSRVHPPVAGEQKSNPAAQRRTDQNLRPCGQRIDRRGRVIRPIPDASVLELAR